MPKLKPILGSCFYAGFLPNAPGTWGSFFALFPIYLVGIFSPYIGMILLTALFSFLTVWVSEACEKEWGGDPSPLVMDEFAGQAMAFVGVSFTGELTYDMSLLLVGFIFFRFFDIQKPLGVNKLQSVPGGWGILLDDLLAGVYAFICMHGLLYIIDTI